MRVLNNTDINDQLIPFHILFYTYSKCLNVNKVDLFVKTSKPTKPEALTEDYSEAVNSSAECDNTLPHDYNIGQLYEKEIQTRLAF